MEKHVGLNPAWFEPGLNGKSPFSELYRKSLYNIQSLDDSISAAFRALIAQDAAQELEPPALQVGDVDKDAEIARLTAEVERFNDYWTVAASQRDEARAEVAARTSIIDGLRAEVDLVKEDRDNLYRATERWRSISDAHEQNYNAMLRRIDEVAAERDALRESHEFQMKLAQGYFDKADALRARFDGGVPVTTRYYNLPGRQWVEGEVESATGTALLIDAQPIADAPEMVEERKGERRVAHLPNPYFRRKSGFYSDRRTTTGTRADRGES